MAFEGVCEVCGRRTKVAFIGGKIICASCHIKRLEKMAFPTKEAYEDAKKAMIEFMDEIKREIKDDDKPIEKVAKAMRIYAKYDKRLKPMRKLMMGFLMARNIYGEGDE